MIGTNFLLNPPEIGPARRPISDIIGPVSTPTVTKPNGILDRIGDFIHSDQGRAALLRSGAATLQGGLGAGIAAGANYVDQQKENAAKQGQLANENMLKMLGLGIDQQQADQTGEHLRNQDQIGLVNADTGVSRAEEAHRHNVSGEGLTARGQDVTRQNNIDTNATSSANNIRSNAQSDTNNRRSTDASRYSTDASIYNTGQTNQTRENVAGIGSKGTRVTTVLPAQPATNPWFGSPTPAVPKRTITGMFNTPPMAAIAALKSNPALKADFEAKYGPGTAAIYGVQ